MNDWRLPVVIAVGGALGSVLRWLLDNQTTEWVEGSSLPPQFPYGTCLVNVIGSTLIGVFFYLGKEAHLWSDLTHYGLTTGVMGGFTTFSSFSLQTFQLFRKGEPQTALVYIGLSVGLCLLGTFLGYQLGAALYPAPPKIS